MSVSPPSAANHGLQLGDAPAPGSYSPATGPIRIVEHLYAHAAERVEVSGEDGMVGEGVLEEGDGERRYAGAGQLAQQGYGEVVGDAGGPLVEGRRGGRRRLLVAELSVRWAFTAAVSGVRHITTEPSTCPASSLGATDE